MKQIRNIAMAMAAGLFLGAGGLGHIGIGAWDHAGGGGVRRPQRRKRDPLADQDLIVAAEGKRERRRERNLRNGL